MCFDCFTRKGCPQLIDRLNWPVAKQWEQTLIFCQRHSQYIVCEISRIQSQKVVSITSSVKRANLCQRRHSQYIVCEISRIQSQKVVPITSSLKIVIRKVSLWLTRTSTKKKIDSARIWGSKWNLLHVVLSAHAHYIQE